MEKKIYKFVLQKNAHKCTCPACGHQRCFVPYVWNDGTNSRVVDAEKYGRCDREQNCAYHLYPNIHTKDEKQFVPVPPLPKPISYIDRAVMERSLTWYNKQTLFRYFTQYIDEDKLREAFIRYNVGTAKNGSTIWWQVDEKNRVRTGKVMQYLPNGHRNKSDFGTWAHKALQFQDYNLKQCLFGMHLVQEGVRVNVVESEKTAVIMSILQPYATWMATGGAGNCQAEKFLPLIARGCHIVLYPDKGMAHKWLLKLGHVANVSDTLERRDDLLDGCDILDLYETVNYSNERAL